MGLWQCMLLAVKSINVNRLRASLTTVGIVIGIASVIIIDALGQGGTANITKDFEKIGSNLFMIQVARDANKPRKVDDLTLSDVSIIQELVPGVEKIAAAAFAGGNVLGDKGQRNSAVIGTLAEFGDLHNLKILTGRFLNQEDIRTRRRVTVIEDRLAEEILHHSGDVGQKIYINNLPLVVVGIIKTDESLVKGNGPVVRNIYVPIDVLRAITPTYMIHSIEGKASRSEDVDKAITSATRILEQRHNKEPGYYRGISLEKEMLTAKKTINLVTLIIKFIAGISLVVGGIGVMNIMLVSVTERTREIGIRKAVGAKRKDILIQFVLEAVVICLVGGFCGIIVGIGGAFIAIKIASLPLVISWWSILLSLVFSIGTGLFFGIYPANKASKLDPIEALRYE